MERRPGALTISEDDRRVLAVWAADCAERTLSLFEARAPDDTRPRYANNGARAFARGEMRSDLCAPFRSRRTRRLARSATRPQSPRPGQ
jgi:hypothetical protein